MILDFGSEDLDIRPKKAHHSETYNVIYKIMYHTLLTAVQGTEVGRPAKRAACLSGAWPMLP
jgi:hypothetical protein